MQINQVTSSSSAMGKREKQVECNPNKQIHIHISLCSIGFNKNIEFDCWVFENVPQCTVNDEAKEVHPSSAKIVTFLKNV